jgi:protein O-mannosyl-transferase
VARLAGCLWRRATAAWVAGLLFAVHPLHADALGLVVGRSELLVAVFVTWMLIRHVRRWETDPEAAPCVKYHVSTALLFLLALASKEHAVIAWPALLLIDGWYARSRAPNGPMPGRAPGSEGIVPDAQNASERPEPFLRRMLASHHLGLMFALAAYLFMRWVVYGPLTTLPADMVNPFANPLLGQPLTVQAASAFALLGLAVRQWFLAAPLCPIWSVGGWALPESFLRADVLWGLAVAGAAVLTMGLGWRRRWRSCVPLAVLLLALLLPCHFVPAANWLYAERWMYLPSVFLAVLCGGLAVWAPRVSVAGALAAAALFLAVCVPYQRCWASHAAVFVGTVQRQPYSYHGLLGVASVHRQAGRVSDAAPEIGRLVERFPQSDRTWFYQALIADERADWDAAAEALRQWGARADPETAPEELQRVAEHVRAHGR